MPYLLTVLSAFVCGVTATLALLARTVVRNRRRIERLERRQQAHGLVIRHLAEEIADPDEPTPPRRPFLRAVEGGAAVLAVLALIRARPARAVLAAGSVAAATVLAVTLTVSHPPARAGTRDTSPAGATAPSVSGAAASPVRSPAASRATVAPSAAAAVAPDPGSAIGSASNTATAGAPVSSVAGPGRPAPSSGTVSPSSGATAGSPTPTPTQTPPTPSTAPPCPVGVQLPPLLGLCLL